MRIFDRSWSRAKAFRDGTHRAIDPAESLAWLWPKARAAGVTRLADVTGLDRLGVPVWVCVRPNSRGLATSQGKGLSHDAARISALMEAIESWHAETIATPVRIADHATMARAGAAIDPVTLDHFRDAPPRPDLPLAWVEGRLLGSDTPCAVPLDAVSTDYVVDARGGHAPALVQSSNGLAGGNHVLEAMTHALTELIERDAVAEHGAAIRAFRPALRVADDSIDDPACRALLDRIEAQGLVTAVFTLPTRFGVPAFACSIMDEDVRQRLRPLPPFNGYGCHLDRGIALLRAITEAAQSRLTFIAGSRDDISLAEYERSSNPDDLERYRVLFDGAAEARFEAAPSHGFDSFEADLTFLNRALADAGLDRIVFVDLSKPGVGVPVVKAVVPGLRTPDTLVRGRPMAAGADTRTREAA